MISRTHLQASVFSAILTLVSASAAAQGTAMPAQQLTSTGIAYVSGGVGDAQQQAMKEAMKDYNLRLTFARQQTGAYLANVKVTIDRIGAGKDATQVLEAASDGPMLFARLPAGNYQLRAQVDGQVQTRTVNIGAQAQDLVLHFPAR